MSLLNDLDKRDIKTLYSIYRYRCLTLSQIYLNYYSDLDSFNKFTDTIVNKFIKHDLVEETLINNSTIVLFLTKNGIDFLKDYYNFPTEVFDEKTKTIKRGYYRAHELKMLPRLVSHQIYLNQFVLDFIRLYNHRKLNTPFTYYDEKYVSQYVGIRPDGLINIFDIDFFLEMDMGTENKSQLLEKWKHYRTFLNSNEYKLNDKKIIVLFIIDNVSNTENRKNVVKLTASEILLDSFDSNFDIIVGTKEELFRRVFNVIFPNITQTNYKLENLVNILYKKHNFSVADGEKIKNRLNNAYYNFYIRKVNSENNIVLENGRIQEFLLDFYYGDDLSSINKISYLDRNSSTFKHYYKRDINYIIVTNDFSTLKKELSIYNIDLYMYENIFITTIDRLDKFPFFQALCQYDGMGRLYTFTDSSLKIRNYNVPNS